MRSFIEAGCMLLLLAVCAPAQRMASTYANLQAFLDSCPQNDPYTPIIRRDFQILRDQAAVGDIACTEPYTQMPAAQVTDELSILQSLRFMYYMDMGRSGYLPWTALRMYDWVKSRISGVNISSSTAGGDCCFTLNGLNYVSVASFAAEAAAGPGEATTAEQAQYHQSPDGVAAEVGLFAHEARHTEGNHYPHVTGCPAFPTDGVFGCDETYDETNIAAYGIQYYLAEQMLTGGINLGYSCSPFAYTDATSLSGLGGLFASLANVFVSRFVTNAPPLLSVPAAPGGPCISASTFSISLASSSATAFTLGIGASNSQAGWTADSAVGWIAPVFGMSSAGSGQAIFAVTPSPGNSAQTGTVVAAGVIFPVVCASVCTFPPVINPGGIVPASSSVSTIQPGEWVSLYGELLSGSTASWNGDFPKSLEGTSVTINGRAAYLSFVSPTQINMQAPDDTSTGTVPVQVTTAFGTSTSTVTLAHVAPSFLLLDNKHVAGIILRSNGSGAYGGGSYDILGPTGNSLGYATVAAKPGDTIELFAVGFGPTDPSVPAGQAFSGAAPIISPISIFINNVSVTPSFVGLSSASLYQINLTVPTGSGTGGDVSLVATVGGVQTPPGLVISLQPTLGPGDSLEATFKSVANTSDLLLFFNNDPLTLTGSPVITTELFNGTNLLVSIVTTPSAPGGNAYSYAAYFTSASSIFIPPIGQSGAVDLTSMQNGSIQGLIKVTVSGGSVSGFRLSDFFLYDAQSVQKNAYRPEGDLTSMPVTLGSASGTAP